MWRFLFLLGCTASFCGNAAEIKPPLVFTGSCDASAVVMLDHDLFVTASDENNVLRFYRLSQPGEPVQSTNLNGMMFGKKKTPEMDIEAAARLGQRIFWIGSHGRKANGEAAPARQRLFAIEVNLTNSTTGVKLSGKPYETLISDLARDPKYTSYQLSSAAEKLPESPGGLNIEALAATPEGGLLIGFRNPVPNGKALLASLLNPDEVINGQKPRFGDPILLDLDGLSLRDMVLTKDGYYLIAGPPADHGSFRLYCWNGGTNPPKQVDGGAIPHAHLEGIIWRETANAPELVVFTDDGGRKINGMVNKDLPEAQQQFRAFCVPLPVSRTGL